MMLYTVSMNFVEPSKKSSYAWAENLLGAMLLQD